jgi:type IV pilus assembly protein PilN
MIKVNLLGNDDSNRASSYVFLGGFMGIFSLLLAGCIYLFMATGSHLVLVQRNSESLAAELKELQQITNEVKELEDKRKMLQAVTSTIETLKAGQLGPVKILDDLNLALPDKSWILSLQENQGNIQIIGVAHSNYEIVNFMQALEISPHFKKVDLVESVAAGLVEVIGYNHFDYNYFRHVVPVSARSAALSDMSQEAKSRGLEFNETSGPPAVSRQQSSHQSEGIITRRPLARESKVSVWTSLEPVTGKTFVINAVVDYAALTQKVIGNE